MSHTLEMHFLYLALAAGLGVISMAISNARSNPGIAEALIMFGGPLARFILIPLFLGLILLGVNAPFMTVLGYVVVFLVAQLATLTASFNTAGGTLSKRTIRQNNLTVKLCLLLPLVCLFAPAGGFIGIAARLGAIATFFVYEHLAAMILDSLSHIDTGFPDDK